MNAIACAAALFAADTFTLTDEDGASTPPPGDWRDVEGPEEAPDAD